MKTNRPLLLSTLIALSVLAPLTQAQGADSPEDICFAEITKGVSGNAAFKYFMGDRSIPLDLSRVRKINGKGQKYKSKPFSVATYDDFIKAFQNEVPFFQPDIVYYPDEMENVPKKFKYGPKIHKANRNNSASIIYNNGVKTPIDHWMSRNGESATLDIQNYFAGKISAEKLDKKYDRQNIDGYFLDSRYVTFGRESDLAFSFPNRAANPDSDDYYPTGRPIRDMREYLLYSHHLSAALGGAFLGCGLTRIDPEPPFKLKDYTYSGKSISWENYGGTRMSESTSLLETVADGRFNKAEIDYTTTTREAPVGRLLRFNVLHINYDNKDSFLNTFRTAKFFYEEMLLAKRLNRAFLAMRRAFYQRVVDSGLGIGSASFRIPDAASNTMLRGTMCGISTSQDSIAPQKCYGQNPKVSCPNGYKQKQWTGITGQSEKWSSCFKTNTQEVSSTKDHAGLFCGLKMSAAPDSLQKCQDFDPQDSCPPGYDKRKWAAMGALGGDWYSCFKSKNLISEPIVRGTMCGLKIAQEAKPKMECEGFNPQQGCPAGYTSRRWTDLNSNAKQWYSCFKDAQTVTKQVDSKHFDVARWKLPGLKVSGKVTYFAADQATADKICQVQGKQTNNYYKTGTWLGGTSTPTADGWSYKNLAIARWNEITKTLEPLCTTGAQCINKKIQYRNKLRCIAYN